MNKKKYIILILVSLVIGLFMGQLIRIDLPFQNKKIEVKESDKIDFSFLNKVEAVLNQKFIDTRENRSKIISKDDKIFGAAEGLVSSRGDMHTMFFPPEDNEMFMDDIGGEFSGVGMEITNLDGYLTVVAPLPNSPAFKSGIKPKDIISKIDGKDAINMSSSTAVKIIRGKEGTKVNLEILRKGEKEPLKIQITRGKIKIPIVKSFIQNDVFVIKLFSFTENSPEMFFRKIITDFKNSKKDKMIIDLRGNSGGLLNAGVFISGLFLEQGKKIVSEDYDGKRKEIVWKSGDIHENPEKTTNIFKNLKLGILVDGGTASASEILTGALLDHKKAIVMGKNTFGKGTVQEMVQFENGSSVKVTVARFILPNGEWISYKGIKPDIEIDMPDGEWKKIRDKGAYSNYVDEQLKVAIKEMNKIKDQKDFINKIEEFAKKRKEEEDKKPVIVD